MSVICTCMSYVLQLYTMELASLLERVSKYAESSTPPNTQKQNEWVKKLYNDWAAIYIFKM